MARRRWPSPRDGCRGCRDNVDGWEQVARGFCYRCNNPFVGEELTRDVEGDRVVLFLVVPGPDGGFFVASDGQCLIDVSRATESAIDGQATCDSVMDAGTEVALEVTFRAEQT